MVVSLAPLKRWLASVPNHYGELPRRRNRQTWKVLSNTSLQTSHPVRRRTRPRPQAGRPRPRHDPSPRRPTGTAVHRFRLVAAVIVLPKWSASAPGYRVISSATGRLGWKMVIQQHSTDHPDRRTYCSPCRLRYNISANEHDAPQHASRSGTVHSRIAPSACLVQG